MIARDQVDQLSFAEIVQLIKAAERELFVFCQSLSEEAVTSRVKRLRETVEKIGASVVRRPPPLERYLLQWQEYSSGKRKHIDPAAARYLCWEPEISMDYQFVGYLERFPSVLGSRPLIGLVHSCHSKWESVSPTVMDKIRVFVMKYEGPNKAVKKWRSNPDTVLHQEGPAVLARRLLRAEQTIREFVDEWYLDPQSAFLQKIVAAAASSCRATIGTSSHKPHALFEDLLRWQGWKIHDLKAEVQQLILHNEVQKIHEPLQRFVLGHRDLGDPRLPRNRDRNWTSISREATNRFVQMLCKEDIIFFFDYVYSMGEDKHKRKEFWLRYVSRYIASRPLLTATDRLRLKVELGARMKNPGEIKGSTNSAFMLDFGELTVVEFSTVGFCYIYESKLFREIVPDFWSAHAFTATSLKDKRRARRVRHWITYNIDWRDEVTNILAQWGIRPGSAI